MKNEIVIERSIYRSFPGMPDREVDHAYSRNTDKGNCLCPRTLSIRKAFIISEKY